MEEVVELTESEAIAAFTEWDRRYRENPEWFTSVAVHLLQGDAETYGEEAAPYFLAIIAELRAA